MNPAPADRSGLLNALLLALVLTGFLALAFLHLGRQSVTGSRHGIIIEKTFIPAPERQITLGAGGLKARDVSGIYRFTVRVGEGPSAREFHVFVDARVYAQHKVGDRYFFVNPPGDTPSEPTASPTPPPAP